MAEGIWGKIITWGLLILFLFIILFAFYNPKTGFMSNIAQSSIGFLKFLPFGQSKELKKDDSLSQNTISTHQKFIESLLKYRDKGNCLLDYNDLSDLGDLRIEILNYQGTISSRIEKPVGKEGGVKLNPIEIKDEKLQLCVIQPEAFYNCYLSQEADCTKKVYIEKNKIQFAKDEIIIDSNNYKSSKGFLFKPEKDKICFIPTHSYTGDSWYKLWQIFTKWGCDSSIATIDDDCIQQLRKKIKLCSDIKEGTVLV